MIKSPLFAGLNAEERDALARRGLPRSFAAGETLFTQGEAAQELFVIAKGRIKLWRGFEDGGALTLTILGKGQPIGVMGAFDSAVNAATASAETAVEVVAWPMDLLRDMMRRSPRLAANVLAAVSRHAERLIERLEDFASVPVEQRLARTLLRMASDAQGVRDKDGCDLPLSRQDLAELTSATLSTVSRIMSRWRSEGVIGGGRGRVILLDCAELARLARSPEPAR